MPAKTPTAAETSPAAASNAPAGLATADADTLDHLTVEAAEPRPLVAGPRTQRGLMVAGSIVLVVVVAVLFGRPHPADRLGDATTSTHLPTFLEDQSPVSAGLLDEDFAAGASSKLPTAESTTTTAAVAPAAGSTDGGAAPVATAPPTTARTSTGAGSYTAPSTSGRVLAVSNPDQWANAVVAAQPGDTIKLVANIYQSLQYHGSLYQADRQKGTDGTAARPITITAADGVWIDPGDQHNNKGALDILFTTNVNVIGVRVRNSQFGIRVLQSSGTAQSPILVAGNTVTDIGHAGIHIGGNYDNHAPSHYLRVEGNTVTRTGRIEGQYGEGIYLGYGSQDWADQTSNVQVVGNDISYVTAEAVDIKPGVRHIVVEGNTIHDLSTLGGGAITVCYLNNGPDPNPGETIDVVLRRNRIWNFNLDGRSNDWAIWVGHGGVTIDSNAIWGLRSDPNSTRAVRIRNTFDFGRYPIKIVNNVFWTATGWLAEAYPSGASLVQASANKGPSGAQGIEIGTGQRSGVPSLGNPGNADTGSGPGSALGF